jgi:hypothetical protein
LIREGIGRAAAFLAEWLCRLEWGTRSSARVAIR